MRALVERYENDFLERYDSLLTPVERSDVFRILVCQHFGGIYADLDTELIRHPAAWIGGSDMDTWTDPQTGKAYGYYNTSVTPDYETPVVSLLWGLEADNDPESDAYWRRSYTYPQQLSQWAFASAPQHPVFERYMDNLRNYTRDNETAAQNSDPLKRTGPAAVTLATKSWLEERMGFRWTSLTGVKDGGISKLVEDILILPITGFHPSHGTRNDIMGRKPRTDPTARLIHHGAGSWKHFNFVGEYGKALGIASSAAGLLSLAIEVTKLSYTYIASVRGAPKSLTSYIARDRNGRTPIMDLMTASYKENAVTIYKLLVSRGASISIQDTEDNSLMHYALRTCNPTVVQMLCTAGLSIETPNKSGQLPLHWMAHWKYFNLRKLVTPDEVQVVRKKRRDCMKLVFQLSSLSSLLVSERLPSVSTPGSRDPTILYYELQPLPFDDWTRIVQLLLDTAADINSMDWKGNTPLQLCVQRAASIPVIDTLLRLGASPYDAGKDGLDCFQIALLCSEEAGSWEIMGCLRTYANTHPDPRHYFCQGGFLIAANTPIQNEETRYLQVLRQTGAINCETRSGRTLIYEAARRGNTRLTRRLLEHDAYPHYVDDFGSSALHAAAKQQSPTTVTVFLQAGADVHHTSVDEYGFTVTGTPLYVCLDACDGCKIKTETVETVRILLSYGADPNYTAVKDDHAETSISLCLKALGHSVYHTQLDAIASEDSDHLLLEVLKVLVDAGARVAESADDIIVGVIAKMEGYESLWEEMRSQLMSRRSDALSLGVER
ncbi:ankyrin repeat domain-containing protein [Fusarium napiforme]|uniref:Ankyrin repeat domain-containing protein n=1 Tax=Fusarium napiforme TaxID=42672 RepID=A0A8H5NIP4_9HYPO|nr:ankyrin repeat domain-containing protein [Fusarium napiforme]